MSGGLLPYSGGMGSRSSPTTADRMRQASGRSQRARGAVPEAQRRSTEKVRRAQGEYRAVIRSRLVGQAPAANLRP
jgi:hypothetical protein